MRSCMYYVLDTDLVGGPYHIGKLVEGEKPETNLQVQL